LEERATQTIEITEFLPREEIDPIYFQKAFYLGPDKGGDRAYTLLSKALSETNRWALAKYAARGKQYLVVLRPLGKGLILQQVIDLMEALKASLASPKKGKSTSASKLPIKVEADRKAAKAAPRTAAARAKSR